ncbi:alpha-N-acetyl-neuraminyl-2,3-beta-galactosyl-1,3-N-acetyl-galactosaminide alpha-2,6-sialyltransferase-like [Limulus polyphemus]|uniref:Alpha-N-acetyl-neuraminyl-2,3-beta-galactosyl-1, 3-N-acetyl-galactosaminide alpha-2,6-sialyltransferase-like n=1 Tax=Limulus polyphemus TaxID=6850 RepID=A0ABM1SEP6_LIMPO|nr:alpha-N-acetyl-neuraminyl-2,3-beta-galactosyl-1,3-N-acetyl-galactosaminide alpha-2,6-sialyltransferase-like [Limulus polyphemus]XP_022242101.1 alpha-N-acetyl-neuraminyl-2,3-beta-galactosyl-1,3-N-acetyl-galactosaminide alpha-2,6-sialyltransferase-like [Limulus polyphemus]
MLSSYAKCLLVLTTSGFVIHLIFGLSDFSKASEDKSNFIHFPSDFSSSNKRHSYPLSNMKMHDLSEQYRDFKKYHSRLVARRDLLGVQIISGPTGYRDYNGEITAMKLKCRTCSLVGTSGLLLGSKKGVTIDQSDCVFRLGLSSVRQLEDDVGKKTTARVLDNESLGLLLKTFQKMLTGTLTSQNVFVHDTRGAGSELYTMRMRLKHLSRYDKNVTFYFLDRHSEHRALMAMRVAAAVVGYKMLGVKPSTLWYAVYIMTDAGCSSVKIIGLPDPKYCKRSVRGFIRSQYWDRHSPSLCSSGNDIGATGEFTADSLPLRIYDRRAVQGWALSQDVTFLSPSWPQTNFK